MEAWVVVEAAVRSAASGCGRAGGCGGAVAAVRDGELRNGIGESGALGFVS
jgi:hypothetical protein